MLLPFQGAPMKIRLIPRVSLRLPWAMRLLGFQPAHFAPLTVSSAYPLRLPWTMRLLGFAMHYWLHLSNSSMLDCIRFERSFSPFETKSETLVSIIQDAYRAALFIPHHKLRGANQLLLSPLSTRSSLRRPTPPCYIACPDGLGRGRMARV